MRSCVVFAPFAVSELLFAVMELVYALGALKLSKLNDALT